jgi:DNA-directed RNA polymerase subunit RPC12/RpoP
MALFDKLNDLARNIGDKTTDAIETTKLNSKINSEKTAITEITRQLGDFYYQKHAAGETLDPGVTELCAAIDGHNQAIAAAQAEIAKIKTENAAPPTDPVPAVPAAVSADRQDSQAPAADGIACPSCGKANPPGTKFCVECGGKIETPAEPPTPEKIICPACSAELLTGAKFCGECGHKFE